MYELRSVVGNKTKINGYKTILQKFFLIFFYNSCCSPFIWLCVLCVYSHLYILIIDFLLVSRLVLLCSFKVNYVVTFSIYEKKPFDVITYNIRFLSNYIKALIMAHIEIVDLQDYLSIICKGMCITTYGNNLSISPRIIYDLCRKKDIYLLFLQLKSFLPLIGFNNETKYYLQI